MINGYAGKSARPAVKLYREDRNDSLRRIELLDRHELIGLISCAVPVWTENSNANVSLRNTSSAIWGVLKCRRDRYDVTNVIDVGQVLCGCFS